ncbi:MAG: hypothetical protein LR011_04530 [Verrucomicrobia bacterium]|nr:hypothetical protein [Verrucomicrobiota bacterium]
MSTHQFYEFQAIDKRLTDEEMGVLRSLSTKAQISATRFVNVYNYGDFRGNVGTWMNEYFDAHLHIAS